MTSRSTPTRAVPPGERDEGIEAHRVAGRRVGCHRERRVGQFDRGRAGRRAAGDRGGHYNGGTAPAPAALWRRVGRKPGFVHIA